jgi:hypothetical protein
VALVSISELDRESALIAILTLVLAGLVSSQAAAGLSLTS